MIRLPKEDLPTYILRYPRPVRLARSGLLFLLIGGQGCVGHWPGCTMWGWQAIPWAAITTVRVAGFEQSRRRVGGET